MPQIMLQSALAILETFVAFALGGWLIRRKTLDAQGIKQLSDLALDVLFPMMTVASISQGVSRTELRTLWILPAMAIAIMGIGYLAGRFFVRFLRCKTSARQAMFQHFAACNNYLFLPLIVLSNLWGARAVALLMILNIGSTIAYWTIGIAAFGGASKREIVRNIFSINLYAVIVGLGMVALDWRLPPVLDHLFNSFGSASVPLVLLGIGAAIYTNRADLTKHIGDCIYLTLIRLILLPALFIALLKLLPLPREYYQVLAVVVLMPVSSSSVLLARRYGGDLVLASQAIVVTTAASLVTIPIFLALFL